MHLAPGMAERIGMLLELTVGTGLRHSRITYMPVPSRSLP